MGTVVVCFYGVALWIVGVCVEGVEVGAYSFDWSKVLQRGLTILILVSLHVVT